MAIINRAMGAASRRADDASGPELGAHWHALAVAGPAPAELAPLGGESRVNTTNSLYDYDGCVAALAGGGYVIVWAGAASEGTIYGQLYNAAGAKVGGEFIVNSQPTGIEGNPSIGALADGGFVVAWGWAPTGGTGVHDTEIFARRFTAAAAPVGFDFQVNTVDTGGQRYAQVAGLADGGFVISWDRWGSAADISGQVFGANGGPIGGEFNLAWETSNVSDGRSSVAALDGGGFVVIFESLLGGSAEQLELSGQRFDSDGSKLGAQFRINVTVPGNQGQGDVSALDGGGFVVSWWAAAGSGAVVTARVYDPTGAPLTGEIAVAAVEKNPNASSFFNSTSVTRLDDGGFLVAWTDMNAAGVQRIMARAFDANGAPTGETFQVSEGTATNYFLTQDAVATLADGSLVFTWEGAGAGDPDGIFTRRFEGPEGAPAPIVGTGDNDALAGTPEGDAMEGLGGDDVLSGLLGDDHLTGGDGNDVLYGAGGLDTTDGGAGDDVHVLDASGDIVIESAGGGSDLVFTQQSYALAAGVSVEVLSTHFHAGTDAVDLTGNEVAQTIIGNNGANVIDGRGGADLMYGLGGDDTYVVDNAGDQVMEGGGRGSDQVLTSVSYRLANGQEIERLSASVPTGTDPLALTGNDLANILTGNDGANYLNGNAGADTMIGLGGHDIYVVENALDVVTEAAGGGSDLVYSFVSYTLGAGQAVEAMSTAGQAATDALNLTGNELGQIVVGNAGSNVIDGKGGNDSLYGLGGADFFAFTTALGAGNVDTLADFSVADDTIQLDDAIFAALGGLGALNANAFVTGTGAADTDDRIVYNSATGALLYDADGTGAIAAVQFATLATGLTLTASDFAVI